MRSQIVFLLFVVLLVLAGGTAWLLQWWQRTWLRDRRRMRGYKVGETYRAPRRA
jgi:hypothetical protein